MIYQATPLEVHILQVMVSDFKPRKFEGASLNTFLVIAIWKWLFTKRCSKSVLSIGTPSPLKHPIVEKTIGSRELIFWTIHIKKCMNNLEFFQPNLRRSSGEMSLNWYVWRGMTQYGIQFDSHLQSQDCAGTPEFFWVHTQLHECEENFAEFDEKCKGL